MCRISLVAILACMTVSPAAAQPADSGLEEKEVVALRLIDVSVQRRNGDPLVDLKADNFKVVIAGQPRQIRTFDSATITTGFPAATVEPDEAGRPGAASQPTPQPLRWVMICLDADRIPHNYRTVVLETARALVEDGSSPRDRFAVVLLQNGDARFVQQFEPAERVELSLLENPDMLLGRANDLRYRLDEMIDLVKTCPDTANQDSCILTRTEEFLNTIRRENEQGLRALRKLISAMAPLPGRKAFVWLSNGFVLEPGQVVMEAVTRYVGSEPRFILSRLKDPGDPAYETLLWDATRARVSFFSLRAGQDLGVAMRSAQEASVSRRISGYAGDPYKLATTLSSDALRDAADATGGRAIFTPLGPKVAVDLLRNMDAIYTLGVDIRPEDPPRPKVKVSLKGVKGKLNVSKQLPRRAQAPERLVAWLTPPAEDDGEVARVLLHVKLDEVATDKDRVTGSEQSRFALYAQVRRTDGSPLDHLYTVVEIPRDPTEAGDFTYAFDFRLDPGEYVAEVAVADLIGHARQSLGTDFVVSADP